MTRRRLAALRTLAVVACLSGISEAAVLGKVPLFFEANQGQVDPAARFVARGNGLTGFLTSREAVIALRGTDAPAVVRMVWLGANPAPEILGQEELPGKVNYLTGRDPARWQRNVPTYARVVYRALYPGIDLVLYGNGRDLEYDFLVAAGADPGAIRLRFEGAESLKLDAEGALILATAGGELRLQKPVAYQEVEGARREIASRFAIGGAQVAFELGPYDRTRPLVIDPRLVYSTYLGGSSNDSGNAIAVDGAGSVYVTGLAFSSDFPTAGPFQPAQSGVFVTKLTPDGSALVYSTILGRGYGRGIAVDTAGNAYVTGATDSPSFPTVNAAQPLIYGDGVPPDCNPQCRAPQDNAFVSKLDASGSSLVYSTYFGGHAITTGSAIAVDADGNAYVAGAGGSDIPVTNHLHPTAHGGAFVLKYSPGGQLLYATDFGRGGASGIAVDASGSAYVTGSNAGRTDFPVTAGAYQVAPGGPCTLPDSGPCIDAFVAKLDAAGRTLVYSTYLGGNGGDQATGVALDGAGNAYVTGSTTSTDFPTTTDAFQPAFRGGTCRFGPCSEAFLSKLDAAGSTLLYSTYLGGSAPDYGVGVALDPSGMVYLVGHTSSTDFPTASPIQASLAGRSCETAECFDLFVAKLDLGRSTLVYATYLGGTSVESAGGIAVDAAGGAYVTGMTESRDFPTAAAMQPANAGTTVWMDAFVAKIADTVSSGTGFAVGPTTASPDPVAPGGTETIQVRVTSGAAASNVLVDLEIYNSAGQKIDVKVFGGQSFAAGEGRTYTWPYPVPTSLAQGEYTVKVGIFSGDWSTLHTWENHAADFTVQAGSPPPPGSCTGGFTVGPTTATPSPVAAGGTETIQTKVCSGSAASNIIVDLNIYNPGGTRVAQNVISGQSFAAGEAKSYSWPWPVPAGAAAGTYTVKIGVFSGDWSILHKWDNQAATFTVGSGSPPPPGSCTGGFTIGPTTATPSPVAPGGTETIQTKVCSGAAASNILVDLEIYDAAGTHVAQNAITGQSFAAGEAKTYSWPWPVPAGAATGPYTVKIGVFSGDWSVLHKWDNQAAAFQIGSGSPPPGSCTGGFSTGPTTATPSPVARGGTETIQARVCSGSAASNILVDLELYNSSGARVAQNIVTGQTFAAGEAKTYTWNYAVPTTLAPGTYTVKIGVFSGDWSTLHTWDNQAATFVVQ